MVNIAVCIPTYQRHECVYEFYMSIRNIIKSIIWIFIIMIQALMIRHSPLSVNIVKTQRVSTTYGCLVDMHPNTKVYKIFQQYGLKKTMILYGYVMMLSGFQSRRLVKFIKNRCFI